MRSKFLLFVIVVVLALVIWTSYEAERFLEDFLAVSGKLIAGNEIVVGLIFFVLGAFSAMFAFFSSVVLVPVAVYNFGLFPTFVLLFGSWLLGGTAAYFIGKGLGRRIINRFWASGKLDYYENLIADKLNFFLVLLFRLAMPAEIPGYLLGILRYGFKPYLLATALAELPFALGAVYGSEFFLNRQKSLFIAVLAAAALIFTIAFYFFRRRTDSIK
ncbi:MAG: hypothetical protein UY26_C0002G0051 [Candidatus Jorgensenbacteria bacterium GW2011_GWA1_48_13]|uniref:TVP38/TMEM64 family membrane protein n=1 Tax=Candidatus Jorgensenbacteria bacterium GW2011_GWB1_50_10 TaxID=1618665 RepID=A0A0G1Z8U0_9BACT|nr:MAG: hypothetical protein UX26_C0014G0016 [Parcubacteria group bacterium GW2011_GWC1_45_9]KKU94269.1 MAG: hypothetical protein UY26_C0002G0051 [Candidatus Jorgensenbacteria bacterium GW2011_GWA1_48_13]KKW15459.1 MAG: hypothetical protein UY55_C0001G0213 [Candidatus Jorgensenbacteria bacterium GW2011_GWB1_50_10]